MTSKGFKNRVETALAHVIAWGMILLAMSAIVALNIWAWSNIFGK